MITTSTDRRHPSKPNSHRLDEQGARHHPTAPLVGDHGTADGDHDVGRGVDTQPTGTWSGASPTGHHHVRSVHEAEPFTRLPALRFGRWTAFDDLGRSFRSDPRRTQASRSSPSRTRHWIEVLDWDKSHPRTVGLDLIRVHTEEVRGSIPRSPTALLQARGHPDDDLGGLSASSATVRRCRVAVGEAVRFY
jgi:hypothetical protein